MTDTEPQATHPRKAYSRRALLGAFGAGAVAVAGVGAAAAVARDANQPVDPQDLTYDFFGQHQAGIATPMQDHLHFAAFDVTTSSRDELVALLQRWTQAAAVMSTGVPIGRFGAGGAYDAPPEDTGEAVELPPSGLTITFGFGPSLFRTADGVDRFGIANQMPDYFTDLPHFPSDMIDEAISRGDLCVQACANEAQVAVHAVRNLARIAMGTATVRWSQIGFGRSSSTTKALPTPRNLFGFKDGTRNVMGDDQGSLDDFVWVQPGDGPDWMVNGTTLMVRKIRMTIETWDRASLREQETIFGRTKASGAPLSGGEEFTEPDFAAVGGDGQPLISPYSHMAVGHPDQNSGQRILRRAYNYTDGSDGIGRLDAGLFYLAFARSLVDQTIPIQMNLSRNDLMNEYVRYISSASFLIPPGVEREGDFIGQTLFG